MSHIWIFSPSSEPLLQQCLAAASLQAIDNKWTKLFGRQTEKITHKLEESEQKTIHEVFEIAPSPEKIDMIAETVSYEDFFESIENEFRPDLIDKECTKNPDLIQKMAQRLSKNTVEKLFNDIIFKDINNNLSRKFILHFLPNYIKQQYSLLCIDILSKTSDKYPELFQILLKLLLDDTEIPNQVLNNFTTINENHTKFMQSLTYIELTSESFVHNIVTIYTAYKDCAKDDRIQSYVKSSLLRHSQRCCIDRNYGRLFLTYLQTAKTFGHHVDVKQLEECLEFHRSPFKRPCSMILKELIEN